MSPGNLPGLWETLLLTDAEKVALQRIADIDGVSVEEWIRSAVDAQLIARFSTDRANGATVVPFTLKRGSE